MSKCTLFALDLCTWLLLVCVRHLSGSFAAVSLGVTERGTFMKKSEGSSVAAFSLDVAEGASLKRSREHPRVSASSLMFGKGARTNNSRVHREIMADGAVSNGGVIAALPARGSTDLRISHHFLAVTLRDFDDIVDNILFSYGNWRRVAVYAGSSASMAQRRVISADVIATTGTCPNHICVAANVTPVLDPKTFTQPFVKKYAECASKTDPEKCVDIKNCSWRNTTQVGLRGNFPKCETSATGADSRLQFDLAGCGPWLSTIFSSPCSGAPPCDPRCESISKPDENGNDKSKCVDTAAEMQERDAKLLKIDTPVEYLSCMAGLDGAPSLANPSQCLLDVTPADCKLKHVLDCEAKVNKSTCDAHETCEFIEKTNRKNGTSKHVCVPKITHLLTVFKPIGLQPLLAEFVPCVAKGVKCDADEVDPAYAPKKKGHALLGILLLCCCCCFCTASLFNMARLRKKPQGKHHQAEEHGAEQQQGEWGYEAEGWGEQPYGGEEAYGAALGGWEAAEGYGAPAESHGS